MSVCRVAATPVTFRTTAVAPGRCPGRVPGDLQLADLPGPQRAAVVAGVQQPSRRDRTYVAPVFRSA
jgi:hypothetical protein